jgi:hypothetical protein
MVEETFAPGDDVSLVARQQRRCAKPVIQLAPIGGARQPHAAGSGEEVVPASDYRTLQNQVRELHRLLGKKTLEVKILKEALEHATGSKNVWPAPSARGLCKIQALAQTTALIGSRICGRHRIVGPHPVSTGQVA